MTLRNTSCKNVLLTAVMPKMFISSLLLDIVFFFSYHLFDLISSHLISPHLIPFHRRRLSDTSQGRAAAFGRNVGEVLQDIKKGRFSDEVMGPLGLYVKIAVSPSKFKFSYFLDGITFNLVQL